MDQAEFIVRHLGNIGPGAVSLPEAKAYANSASDEIHRLRRNLDEATTHIKWLERQLDNASAVAGIGIQPVVDPEVEDAMSSATAELVADGRRAVAEVQAERDRAAALVQAQCAEASTVVEAVEEWMVFDKSSCSTALFSTHWNYWQLL